MFTTGIIYRDNLKATEPICVNQGGTSSGKTYGILQVLLSLAMSFPLSVTTVVGQDIPNLKRGAWRMSQSIITDDEQMRKWFPVINQTDRIIKCINGSIMEFCSFENEQDAKGAKRDFLFLNEADAIPFSIYQQLVLRTKYRTFIDYNPSCRFWVHDELIGKPGVRLLISDHRHNPFLTKEQHDKIESIKDPEYFKVYARGKTGKMEGLVYTDWEVVEAMPESYSREWYGLDFGFTNDPTSLIHVVLSGGSLWIDEICYQTGMLNKHIHDIAIKSGIRNHHDIIADCAEPKSIAELRGFGLKVEPSIKGADSVRNGIDILKRYHLCVTRRSTNTRKELGAYRWALNKHGVPTNEPVDFMNHALDAVRYVALNKLSVKRVTQGGYFTF